MENEKLVGNERVLARKLARELTEDEYDAVFGGTWVDTSSGGRSDACDGDPVLV